LGLKDRLKIIRIQSGDENIISKEELRLNTTGNNKVAAEIAKVIPCRQISNF
jgi:hypothetical protein